MSELKAYKMIDEKYCTDCLCVIPSDVYLKSEADKVIAELKDDVTYWKKVAKKNMDDNVAMARERAKAFESERRRKYKQCVAMAKWCKERSERYFSWSKKMDFILKWQKRWLELADKYKEEA